MHDLLSGLNSLLGDYYGVLLQALLLMVVLGPLVGRWWQRRIVAPSDGPILASAQMLGDTGLQSMAVGKIADFTYNMLTNNSGRVMFSVDLGHNSWSHILAYGDKSAVTAPLFGVFGLEPTTLEGDFPDYFHMYCNPEAQDTIREVFAPDVMAQFADFCRGYDFEIFHDALYISRAKNVHDADDQTSLTTDLTNFLTKNAETLRRL